jgi:Lon protease-like protein
MPNHARELPAEPHLDHLKKQAKDLLEAHKRGDPQAAQRLREALPAFARMSDAEVLRAPLALHDAQSAIAREYGQKSWSDLRAEVARRRERVFPAALFQAMEPQLRAMWGRPMPAAVADALKQAWSSDVSGAAKAPVPERLPLLAIRNAMLVPGALAPFHIGRPSSIAAIEEASRSSPRALAAFAQRDATSEDVRVETLHPVGCQALVHAYFAEEDGKAFVVLRGLRWIALDAVEPAAAGQALFTRVTALEVDDVAGAEEVPALFEALRERARSIVRAMPEPAQVLSILDGIEDPERLADLVVGNLWCSVDDKARYAAQRTVRDKLRTAITLVDALPRPGAGT